MAINTGLVIDPKTGLATTEISPPLGFTPTKEQLDTASIFQPQPTQTPTPVIQPTDTTAQQMQGQFYQVPGQNAVYRWVNGKLTPFTSEQEGVAGGLVKGTVGGTGIIVTKQL